MGGEGLPVLFVCPLCSQASLSDSASFPSSLFVRWSPPFLIVRLSILSHCPIGIPCDPMCPIVHPLLSDCAGLLSDGGHLLSDRHNSPQNQPQKMPLRCKIVPQNSVKCRHVGKNFSFSQQWEGRKFLGNSIFLDFSLHYTTIR